MLNTRDLILPVIEKNALGILIKNPSNLFYITHFSGEGYVYAADTGKINLYADGRYAERAVKECPKDITVIRVNDIYKDIAEDISSKIASGRNIADKNKPAVMFESNYMTYDDYSAFAGEFKNRIKLIPACRGVSKIRSLKDKDELCDIIEAISIAEKSIARALKTFLNRGLNSGAIPEENRAEQSATRLKPAYKTYKLKKKTFLTEKDFALIYKKNLIDSYSEESFETIALSGKNSSLPHGLPSDVKIDEKGILLCDFGAKRNGYKSDETFTVHLGNPDDKFLDVYDTVYSAQQLAVSKIKPGVKFSYLDKIARDYIEKKGYGKYFTHSLGHGVGLDIHEYPYLSKKNDDTVKEGMVFTVEPGIYIEGEFGVRIEDMCYVEKDGVRVITNIKKHNCKIEDAGII